MGVVFLRFDPSRLFATLVGFTSSTSSWDLEQDLAHRVAIERPRDATRRSVRRVTVDEGASNSDDS